MWRRRGVTEQAIAEGEVILSAGAINTPQLMQLSGIGNGNLLKSLGIDIVHELSGVGENFQDHLQVRLVYRANRPCTLNDDLGSPIRAAALGLRYLLQRKGGLTVSAGYAGGFFRSDRALDQRPDTQIHFITFSANAMGDRLHPFSAFTASACPLRPESRGHVRIVSPEPSVSPEIIANFLDTPNDQAAIVSSTKLVRTVLQQPAMQALSSGEEAPGPDIRTDEALLEYARATGGSLYHASCTAALGSVVDDRLRVIGLDALRVVDASIMPAVVSGNTNASVIAIAEKGADLIMGNMI